MLSTFVVVVVGHYRLVKDGLPDIHDVVTHDVPLKFESTIGMIQGIMIYSHSPFQAKSHLP